MKENVLDVLMYLFENYMYEEPETDPDRESLQSSLLQAGFSQVEINKAFEWLDGLADQRHLGDVQANPGGPIRIYSEVEEQRLDTECRGFLQFLENTGVIDSIRRELIIDRVMALESEEVDLEDLKWVVLMVLFNQPGQEASYAWMESLLFENHTEYQH
jgi:Smg protein